MSLSEKVRECIRDVPDFPKPGIVFKDITPLLNDPAALAMAVEQMANPFRGKGIELVVGGFNWSPLSSEIHVTSRHQLSMKLLMYGYWGPQTIAMLVYSLFITRDYNTYIYL